MCNALLVDGASQSRRMTLGINASPPSTDVDASIRNFSIEHGAVVCGPLAAISSCRGDPFLSVPLRHADVDAEFCFA